MFKGDLSNETPTRALITLDALLLDPVPKKRRFKSWEDVAQRTSINVLAIGRLWRVMDKGLQFEAVTFDAPSDYSTALEEIFDRRGYPIAWVTNYDDRRNLQNDLAYRPEVKYVIDDQEHALMWGYRGISITDL